MTEQHFSFSGKLLHRTVFGKISIFLVHMKLLSNRCLGVRLQEISLLTNIYFITCGGMDLRIILKERYFMEFFTPKQCMRTGRGRDMVANKN